MALMAGDGFSSLIRPAPDKLNREANNQPLLTSAPQCVILQGTLINTTLIFIGRSIYASRSYFRQGSEEGSECVD